MVLTSVALGIYVDNKREVVTQ